MKILICTFSFPYFGGNVFDSRFVYSEAVGYAENGADVTVLTPHFPGSPELEGCGPRIRIVRFPYFLPKSAQRARVPGKPLYNPDSFLALLQLPVLCLVFIIKIIRQSKYADVIHAQWTVTALLALPAKWISGKKLVLTARGSDIRLLPAWLNRFIFRHVDAAIDCFGPTAWNIRNKSSFPANYISLPHLVYDDGSPEMPAEVKEVKQHDPDTFLILYVGRFHSIKVSESKLPLFDLIPAAAALKRKNYNFHVLYIGDGAADITQKMEAMIRDDEVSDCVSMVGPRTNVMSYMKHCDLGIGGVAFNGVSQELTICKKPQLLIRTDENIQSPWKEDVNALFAMPGDINDLTAKLEWAMNNRDKTNAMGQLASEEMKSHFIESKEGGRYYVDAFSKLANGGEA